MQGAENASGTQSLSTRHIDPKTDAVEGARVHRPIHNTTNNQYANFIDPPNRPTKRDLMATHTAAPFLQRLERHSR